MVFVTVNSYFF